MSKADSGHTPRCKSRRRQLGHRAAVCFAVLAVMAAGIAQSEPLTGQQPLSAALTVLVYNYRHAPLKTLARGEREAGDILGAAGVRVSWVNCPAEVVSAGGASELCARSPGAGVVRLEILPGRAQNNFLETMSGVAVAPNLAGVYYDNIPRLQLDDNSESNSAIILGCVMAHEIGHLLLGSYGHSIGGIMQPQWRTEELHLALMGKLRFSSQESKLMQAESRARSDLNRIAAGGPAN